MVKYALAEFVNKFMFPYLSTANNAVFKACNCWPVLQQLMLWSALVLIQLIESFIRMTSSETLLIINSLCINHFNNAHEFESSTLKLKEQA